ncbi:hypothetical protein VMCG_07906 [Cytospora schulzeri]|uniref:Spen paralogue and orthologue SPOC C-terminal domain-containing protein n=1 Tax=Cytospora schulzeri TaxID=448051 RepID=A0A423W0C8_9PEZI|nr:hypothetical protein VMCG_07906 [Valsa malicola]
MADKAHERGLLETLEQEKAEMQAEMQAAFSQQFQGSFARLRASLDSSRGITEQRMNALERDLQTATQQNETLRKELDVAKKSIQDLTEQLRVANQRASTSEDQLESAKNHADKLSKSATQLFKTLAGQRTQPEADLTFSQQQIQADHHKEGNSRKRKASTERPLQSEGDSTSDLASATAALTTNPVAGERADTVPPRSNDMDLSWTGQVIDAYIGAKFQGVIKHVGAVNSPNTLDRHWTMLVPKDVRTMARVGIPDVTRRIRQSCFDPCTDTIVLHLTPASEADKTAFGQMFESLRSTAQCGILDQPGPDNVKTTFLIPISAMGTRYPRVISLLSPDIIPRTPYEKNILLVIIYALEPAERRKVWLAWDSLIKTVHSSDVTKLAGLRDNTLVGHPLPVLHPREVLLSAPSQVRGEFEHLPVIYQTIHAAELAPHSHSLYHISYSMLNEARAARVDGVKLPECVFVLGLTWGEAVTSMLFVDMMAKDRPLWHLRLTHKFLAEGCSGRKAISGLFLREVH